jgi:7,8-dihydropterin-6-yl-methyl-4-(beta-D-ribofuranosyl)aminobenzene 5'-phosphate synthase
MEKKIYFIALFLSVLFIQCSSQNNAPAYSGKVFESADTGTERTAKATIIYDNYVHSEGMKADWGFSLLLEGLEKTVLFDTGTKPEIFRENFNRLGLEADKIDEVFISHEHGDHFGGLHELLSMNNKVKVVVLNTFSGKFIKQYKGECSSIEAVSVPVEICNGLYSTGVMGKAIPEQSLVLNSPKGLIVMTGCSHPGIIKMLREIKASFNKDIYMVFGGFHLMDASDKEIESIIKSMRSLGVQRCGATHCTGEHQIELFRKAFGKDFVEMGAGNVITLGV